MANAVNMALHEVTFHDGADARRRAGINQIARLQFKSPDKYSIVWDIPNQIANVGTLFSFAINFWPNGTADG